MGKVCWICEADMAEFKDKTVMFDDIPILCSGWRCNNCGEIIFNAKEAPRILKELREARLLRERVGS